jgi:phthiocerol/phenolphthiocerol synthesis type-I polyketide synthase D
MNLGLIFFASTSSGSDAFRLMMSAAEFADTHGFSTIWLPERHFTLTGSLFPNPVLALATLAARTSRIRLHAGSVVAALHDPIRIAEEWAFLDVASGGRAGLAFASGWHANDFALAPERYNDRRVAMLSCLDTVQILWRGEPISRVNGKGETVQIRTFPRPVQAVIPIALAASGSPATFEVAGERGLDILTHVMTQSLEMLGDNVARYRRARIRAGHNGSEGRVTLMMHTCVSEEPSEIVAAQATFVRYLISAGELLGGLAASRDRSIDTVSLSPADRKAYAAFVTGRLASTGRLMFGAPGQCERIAERVHGLGVDELACQVDFGLDETRAAATLKHLAEIVRQERSARRQWKAPGPGAIAPLPPSLAMTQTGPPRIAEVYRGRDEILARLEPRASSAFADLTDLVLAVARLIAPDATCPLRLTGLPAHWAATAETWAHVTLGGITDTGTVEAKVTIHDRQPRPPTWLQPSLPVLRLVWTTVPSSTNANRCAGQPQLPGQFVICGEMPEFQHALCARLRVHGSEAILCSDVSQALHLKYSQGLSKLHAELVVLIPVRTSLGTASPPVAAEAELACFHAFARSAILNRADARLSAVVVSADDDGEAPFVEAMLRSYLRVLAHEHPMLAGRCIAGVHRDGSNLGMLVNELVAGAAESHLRLNGVRSTPRLRPMEPGSETYAWHPHRSYLVTGGAGGLGQAVVQRALARGARYVVLAGRTLQPDSPALNETRRAAARSGAVIHCAALDVADAAALERFLLSYEGPPFAGVFHLAAVMEGGPIEALDDGAFARTLRPKAQGAWNLHQALGNDLDAFVMFSSLAGLLGLYGQGAANYAAANGFLDALALARQRAGKPALSIAWASWREIGRSSAAVFAPHFAARGERTLETARALDMMERLMASGEAHAIVADLDWPLVAGDARGDPDRSLLRDIAGEICPPPAISSKALGAQVTDIVAFLRGLVAETLGKERHVIDVTIPFTDLGVDSLLLLDLRGRIEHELKLVVPIADLLDGASVSSLARTIAIAVPG